MNEERLFDWAAVMLAVYGVAAILDQTIDSVWLAFTSILSAMLLGVIVLYILVNK